MCLALCPLGAISLNPQSKKIIKCDLCSGDPTCVKFCQPKAIDFVRKDRVDIVKKRVAARKVLESIQNQEKLKAGRS
jgi:Fe-S-cluster-containing hydrogenase component 2